MFHKLQGVFPMEDFVLGCKFKNGAVKLYDMKPLMRDDSVFSYFKEHPDIFYQVTVSPGGYGIIWNDDLDLAAEEVWVNGWPEWDENNLVTFEVEINAELLRQAAERLKSFNLSPEDWMVMCLEALVYPATRDKMMEILLRGQDEHAAMEQKEEP